MPSLKVVGSSGQISLGKEYAGRTVLIEQREPGVWIIRTASVIPDNELWLHQPQVRSDLDEAMAWAASHPGEASSGEALRRLGEE